MNFVFIDETGEPGSEISKGASPFFGFALLSVMDKGYEPLRLLLAQVHWLSGTAASIGLGQHHIRASSLLRGLRELACNRIISASGLYIEKEHYGGRYLRWSDIDVPESEWRYYLRNYLLRHLLEFHFTSLDDLREPIDLVVDRVLLTEDQRKNTLEYLNSNVVIPLKEPFKIPSIEFLTVADSQYVGGLEITHVLAEILREIAKGTLSKDIKEASDFMKTACFVGHKKYDE